MISFQVNTILKKIAIFTEGQTELIFVRWFLLRLIDNSKLSFECRELLAHKESPVPYKHFCPDPQIYFRIINVHGEEGVLSSIREREKQFINAGYDEIIGLRDMYSETYLKLSPKRINGVITNMIINNHQSTIRKMTNWNRIKLYFAIMEVEAWFLGMYNLFQKIDPILTVEFIRQNLNIDLKTTDPQKKFYKPSDQLDSIYALCERKYGKKRDEIESICSKMELADYYNARENGRCKCFDAFYQEIRGYG